MPVLAIGQAIETREAALLVENRLSLGGHRFQLVVTDEQGRVSEPAELVVTVRRGLIVGPVSPGLTTLPIGRLTPLPQPPLPPPR